jgi:hypothetical protein
MACGHDVQPKPDPQEGQISLLRFLRFFAAILPF